VELDPTLPLVQSAQTYVFNCMRRVLTMNGIRQELYNTNLLNYGSCSRDQYPSSLKGGMVIMGRPVGPTSAPLPTASPERIKFIEKNLIELGILDTEPHGW
jgi:dihydrodipicolinate synthase/N-acetylneuraminate lyase